MNKFEWYLDLIGEGFVVKYNVMDVIKTFMKQYDAIKMKDATIFSLLDLQHDRQELIDEWFGVAKESYRIDEMKKVSFDSVTSPNYIFKKLKEEQGK